MNKICTDGNGAWLTFIRLDSDEKCILIFKTDILVTMKQIY